MQLVGKRLRHGCTVILRNTDSSIVILSCRATLAPTFQNLTNIVEPISSEPIDEICTWGTELCIERSAESPQATPAASIHTDLPLLLAAHDPDLVARLRAAIHLSLVPLPLLISPAPPFRFPVRRPWITFREDLHDFLHFLRGEATAAAAAIATG